MMMFPSSKLQNLPANQNICEKERFFRFRLSSSVVGTVELG